jgi:succinate dehydrogenase (ubiquinone) membrane anchor subunit
MALNKVLRADAAGPTFQRVYENSHIALAGLTPAAFLTSEGTLPRKAVDVGLGIAIPLHSHIALNAVISDYVPNSVRGLTRWGTLGLTGVAIVGLLKLNLAGPGLSATVKELWKADSKKQ